MHTNWDDVQVFLAVAEAGSLSAAAKRLRVTQPTVSRRLAEIEATMGEALFERSAQGVVLTAFGERLLEPSRRMAEWAAEVDRTVERADTAPSGVVRVTAPPGVAFDFVAPFAGWLHTKLPGISLQVQSTIEYLDLSRRDADLALRFAAPTQRDVITLASLDVEVAAFAAESYVKTLPKRYGLGDIGWIAWAPPLDHLSPNPELSRLIPGFKPIFACDDFLVQVRAAEAGVGGIFLGRAHHPFFPSPKLVELDIDLGPLRRTLYLVCSKSALDIPRVRATADLLASELTRTTTPKKKR